MVWREGGILGREGERVAIGEGGSDDVMHAYG